MASEMADVIRQLAQDKGITEDLVKRTIEDMLKAAYKRAFNRNDNCVVKFSDDMSDVSVYSRKIIVEDQYDELLEIELEDALKLSPDCEIGDEIDILVDPKEFDLSAVSVGKQSVHKILTDTQKNLLKAEYESKKNEIIIGYYQRERNGNIYVDLDRVEGILPKKFQSKREIYEKGNRIRALIKDIKTIPSGVQLVLSRTDPEFVRRIIELEVPEIYDNTVEIYKIVREAGDRTKVAVLSHREDVDPVGACVGLKGVRIQNVIQELEGEKIDILKYDPDPRVFIKNALSPAEVIDVFILDEKTKKALAVVSDSQFSLAIGKQGLNVRLANRLVDWSIDVKTEDQCEELEALTAEARRAANDLFSDTEEGDVSKLADLPEVDARVVELLAANGIELIEDYLYDLEEGKVSSIEGITQEDIAKLQEIIDSVVEIVEEEGEETSAEEATEENGESGEIEEEVYECPECGAHITIDMTKCPNCGVELSFEYEDEE